MQRVFIYKQKSPLNTQAYVSSRDIGLNLCLCLHLHPYFEYGNSEGSDETANVQAGLRLGCSPMRYSKTCLKQPLKNRQKKVLMTNGSLIKVKSIA